MSRRHTSNGLHEDLSFTRQSGEPGEQDLRRYKPYSSYIRLLLSFELIVVEFVKSQIKRVYRSSRL